MNTNRTHRAFFAIAAALVAGAMAIATGPVAPPPPVAEPPFPIGEVEGPIVEATLWVEKGQVMPGAVVWVAVAFKIRPDWHIYWPGMNDTGMAPEFDWKVPEGWKVGAARWPAPTRYIAPGELVDHILEGIPTVLFPIKIPESASGGAGATIACDLEWLVCKTMCIAERQRVQFSFAAFDPNNQSSNARAQDAAVIAMARRALPRPIDELGSGLTASVTGNTLTIKSAGGGVLAFAPSERSRPVLDTLDGCVGEEGKPLFVGLEDAPDRIVEGVVTLREMGRAPRAFGLQIPRIAVAERDGFEIPKPERVP